MPVRHTHILSIFAIAAAVHALAANPTIQISSAKQQFPWAKTVDITYTVTGVTNKEYVAIFEASYEGSIVGVVTNALDGTGRSATATQSYATQWVPTSTDQRSVAITPYLMKLETGYRMTRASNSWTTPSANSTPDISGDDVSVSYTLPFSFPFYGKQYTTIWINSNGTLNFGGSFNTWSPSASTLSNNVMIAVLWRDLKSGRMYITTNTNYVIFRWSSVYYSGGTAVNIEAKLYKTGKIVISFGSGNANGGMVGISSGTGDVVYDFPSSSLASAQDYVFEPTQ